MKELLLLLTTFICLNSSSQKVYFTPVPNWVDAEIPKVTSEVSKNDVLGGAYVSVMDSQSNLITKDDYFYSKTRVLTESGVMSSSELAVFMDTMFNSLDFHYLRVTRNGKTENRTKQLDFELISTEQNLDQKIYTGGVTAYAVLDDIRKDDIIEYAYTLKGENPIFMGNSFRSYGIVSVNPIDYVRVRVIKNKNDRYSISKKNVSENLSWTEQKNHDEFVFSSTNVEPYEIEETTPPWHMGYPAIFISAFASHQEVSVWALEIFKLEETSKKTVSDLAKEITRDKSSKKSKIDTIIRWVQNEIRYMGIESGIGAILPFQPIETIQQRFGDCKDKTLLLTALLNEIGIEAYPLLVNTSLLHEVATLPPAAQLFDHVIVYFEYQGEVYTVDATMPFQGGSLGKRAVYGYSNGLLVKKNEGIINIDYDPNKSKTETREVFEMDDFESPCSLTVITKLTGFNADQMRMIFDMFSSRELSKELMSVYSVLYDVSLLEKLEVTDDIENNIVTLVEQYQINSFFEKKEVAGEEVHLLHYEPVGLYQYISSLSCEPKLHPVYVPFPSNYYQKTNIILPEGLITPPENTVIENDVFEYIYKQEVKNMYDLVLEYSFSTISNEIQNSSFNRVCRDMNQIVQSLPLSLSYPVEP